MAFPTVSWRHTEPPGAVALALVPKDAWGRPSFLALRPSDFALGRIYDADNPLGTRIDLQMSHLDGLLVPATVLVQCLDQLELQAQQSSAIAPVNVDVCLLQVTLAALQKLEASESRGNDLN